MGSREGRNKEKRRKESRVGGKKEGVNGGRDGWMEE